MPPTRQFLLASEDIQLGIHVPSTSGGLGTVDTHITYH